MPKKKTLKCPEQNEILTLLRKLCCPVHKENIHQSTSVSDLWSVSAGAFRVVSGEKHNAMQKQRHLWLCKKQRAIELLNQKLWVSLVLCKICHYYICSLSLNSSIQPQLNVCSLLCVQWKKQQVWLIEILNILMQLLSVESKTDVFIQSFHLLF